MFHPYTGCGLETFRWLRRWGMSPVSEKLYPQHMCRMHGRCWPAAPHLWPTCCADSGATPGHSRCVSSGCQGLKMGRLSRAAHGWYRQCIPRHAGASPIAACASLTNMSKLPLLRTKKPHRTVYSLHRFRFFLENTLLIITGNETLSWEDLCQNSQLSTLWIPMQNKTSFWFVFLLMTHILPIKWTELN